MPQLLNVFLANNPLAAAALQPNLLAAAAALNQAHTLVTIWSFSKAVNFTGNKMLESRSITRVPFSL